MLAKFDVKSTGKVDFEEYCICMGPGHYSHDQHLSRGEIKVSFCFFSILLQNSQK